MKFDRFQVSPLTPDLLDSTVEDWLRQTIDPDDLPDSHSCMEWPFGFTAQGYGQLRWNGKPYTAPRAVLELVTGETPEGAHALHSCDNKRCFNPRHLRWGDHAENMQDASRRGRLVGRATPRGEDHWAAKLTEDEVLAIRRSSLPGPEAARHFGVSTTTVYAIRRNEIWSHL